MNVAWSLQPRFPPPVKPTRLGEKTTLRHSLESTVVILHQRLAESEAFTGEHMKVPYLHVLIASEGDKQDRKAWCVGSESHSGAVNLSWKQGRAGGEWLTGLLPTAHCYPAHEGNHCCAPSLSLTTWVNKDLNNKQRNVGLRVMVRHTGASDASPHRPP